MIPSITVREFKWILFIVLILIYVIATIFTRRIK